MARDWLKTDNASLALFTDKNLILNDEVSKNLEYKHLLAELIAKYCPNFMPLTYSINDENYLDVLAKIRFKHYSPAGEAKEKDLKWILKPSMLNNGDFIKLFNHIDEIKKYYATPNRLGGEHVLQQYLSHPHLYQERKYTFRVAAVLTNYAGVFLYNKGYVNISAHPFTLEDNFQNKKIHITNYLLDGELSHIQQKHTDELKDFSAVHQQMVQIVACVVKALLKIAPSYLKKQTHQIFEIFGFDFMMDEKGKLWLLEINQGPDAPTFEENRLNVLLWDIFWKDIIEDFVLPIALKTEPRNHYANFTQIFTEKETNSWWRRWFKKN
jgi:tubulin--tyrosine ligase